MSSIQYKRKGISAIYLKTVQPQVDDGFLDPSGVCSAAKALTRIEYGASNYVLNHAPRKCFSCGSCVALTEPRKHYLWRKTIGIKKNQLDKFKSWCANKENYGVLFAPGLEKYPQIEMNKVVAAFKSTKIGAKCVVRTIDAAGEAKRAILEEVTTRWRKGERLIIDSRCGSIRNYIRKHRSDLEYTLVRSPSTLLMSANLARKAFPKIDKWLFVGPCIAYKETVTIDTGLIDAVLTWDEFLLATATMIPEGHKDQASSFSHLSPLPFDSYVDDVPTNPIVGYIPTNKDICGTLEEDFEIPSRSLNAYGLSKTSLAQYIASIETAKTKGFLEVLFCGSCIDGPGVFSSWQQDLRSQTNAHQSHQAISALQDNLFQALMQVISPDQAQLDHLKAWIHSNPPKRTPYSVDKFCADLKAVGLGVSASLIVKIGEILANYVIF